MSSTKSQSRGSRRRPPRVPQGRCPIVARPVTREERQRQRVPVALTITSPGCQPQTPGARASPGGRMSPGRSPCASGWIAVLFCARVRRERARSRRCLMAKDGEGGDGSGRGSAPQLQRLPREEGVGVGRERRAPQAGSSQRPPSNRGALSQSQELLRKCRSSHQGLPASHC